MLTSTEHRETMQRLTRESSARSLTAYRAEHAAALDIHGRRIPIIRQRASQRPTEPTAYTIEKRFQDHIDWEHEQRQASY